MRKHWWNSLRVKIIAWSFVPTVIILSAVAWFTFYSYQKVLGDLTIKQYPLIVQPEVQKINDALRGMANKLLVPIILEIDTDHEASLEVRTEKILDYAESLGAFDGGILFVDQGGIVFKAQPGIAELLGQDWSNTPQFRYINENTNYGAWTDLISVKSSGNKIFCIGFAITGQSWDDFLGAGYYCFTVYPATQNVYYEAINAIGLDPNIILLDSNQQVVYSTDQSKMGSDMSGEAYIQQLSQGESKSGRFRIGNQDMLVGYTRIEPMINRQDWFLLTMQSWSEVMRPSLPYRQLLVALLSLGVIVPALMSAYGVRHITGPLQKLIQASEQVTAGQFKHKIEVKTGDEIEMLTDQFNLMSEELADSYATLEKKVADRTHELATLNAIVAQVSSSLNLNEVMADALERLMALTGMEHGIAYRIQGGEGDTANSGTDAGEPHLRVMALRGFPPTFADLGDGLPLRHSAAGVAGQRGEAVIWTLAELPTDSALKERLVTLGVEQVIAIPLMTKGRMVGSLNLSTNQRRTYPPEQVALLNTIGQQIGVAVENAHLYEQAEQGAITAERQRLARELHDAVTQTLFSANLIADVLPRIWQRSPEEGLQSLEELRQLTRGALAEMRTLLLEMRPESLQRADIKSLITQLADAFIGRVRIPLQLEISGSCTLPQEEKVVFYRVAQEALNNVAKHSGARQVELHFECQPGQVRLRIKDDGLGFEPNSVTPDHMGIAIMRERASSIGASLKIESQVGQGTTVELVWVAARRN